MGYECIVKDTCPVCGFYDYDGSIFWKNWENTYQEICPICGTQFGYDDSNLSHEELRKNWVENGMKFWSSSRKKPKNWNPLEQLKNLNLSEEEMKELFPDKL